MKRVSKVSLSRAAIILTVVAGGVGTGFGGVLGGGVAFAGPVPAITPVTVTCGEVITTSTTVANNLTCPGNALTIESDTAITLDLGGHTISGSGTGIGIEATSANGDPEIDNATITNGTIEHFSTAVYLVDAIDPVLSDLNVTHNGGGTRPVIDTGLRTFTDGLLITGSRITDSTGYVILGQIELGGMTISNTRISGGQMFLSQTGGPTFTDDTITNMPLTLDIEGDTTITGSKFVNSPILNIEFGFGNDVFKDNTFSGAATALTIADVNDQQLIGNKFTDNNIGVSFADSPGDTISGNTFSHNSTAGVYFNGAGGVVSGNLPTSAIVSGNTAKVNGTNPDGTLDPAGLPVVGGIYLYTPSGGNTVTNNKTAHNGGYGIYALPPNTFSGNVSTDDFARCYPLNLCTY